MAKNDKHGDSGSEMDFDFDDFDLDDLDGFGEEDKDDRSPRGKLKKFGSTLRDEVFSSHARRQYLEDSLPQKYHTTLNSAHSIADAGADLYNDGILKEWDKSRSTFKKAVKSEGKILRRMKLGKLVDWAEQREDSYESDYNAEEAEVTRGMGQFGGSIKDAMQGGQLSPRERQEMIRGANAEEDLKEDKLENDQAYQQTTVRQQTASVSILNRILEANFRQVDYQDQVDFNYKKKMVEFGIRNLISQRKSLEQTALMRAEMKEGLQAITKNTGLPDYVKITSQENAKRLLRDKMVNSASDWVGSKISGIAKSFMDQTKRNIATMGMEFRDKAGMYVDGKEMMEGVGMNMGDLAMSIGAGFLRGQVSKRGGKYIRKLIEKNSKYTGGLDFTEALLANSGQYANMALNGRSGFQKLDRLLERGGYSGLAQRQNNRLVSSAMDRQDEATYMDNKLKSTFLHAYPAWFSKIWKSIEGLRTGKDPKEIEDQQFDFKFNRLRSKRDLQTEFDNEAMNDNRLHNYHDGIDNWINQLDPKSTFSPEARETIRRWLVENHSKGKESFAVALYRGEGLPKGTSAEVRRELENKVPYLAGFDPMRVTMSMKEGVGLELQTLRENPEYRKKAKALGNADQQARARHPLDNRRLAELTEQYGKDFAVDSGYAKYDKQGNVNTDNDTITKMVLGGGMRNYQQKSDLDDFGDIKTREGMDPNKSVANDDRKSVRRMGRGMNRERYDAWVNESLANINGPRIRGFASGGFTSGDPDEIAGVTHGDEAVIDSEGTKNNKKLLGGIMKLGASVFKNGKINRAYYKYLGFTSPEQIDAINNLKDMDMDALMEQAKKLKEDQLGKAKSRVKQAQDKFNDFRAKHMHKDGYNSNFGPTPDFMGPRRTGGLRNDVQGIMDLVNDPEKLWQKVKVRDRLSNLGTDIREFDYSRIPRAMNDYGARAKEAVKNANNSKRVDFDNTRQAIDKAVQEGKEKEGKLVSLFLEGQNSPFITKGDFATGRFRNKTSGHIITRPADIMDDIVLVDDNGNFETIATMADMLEGVFDSRGNPVKLLGLESGYRKYIKRSTIMGRAIRNTRLGQFVADIKEKIWDDQPVDVCIVVNGNLTTVLKASGFLTAQYLDKETGDVLKSHNDIRGEVVDLKGDTLLTLDELSNGIFDNDGYRLKISKLKHWRNVAVTKIENFVKQKYGQMRDKALDRVLDYFEKKQSQDVYVMRAGAGGRELAKAFSMEDLKNGQLMLASSSQTIKKLSDITGPVYSKITKSIVVKQDELEYGFFNEDGTPFKDWKGMSVEDRLDHQKQRVLDKLSKSFSNLAANFKSGWKKAEDNEDEDEDLSSGDEPCDVYILQDGDLKKVLTKQGFIDHAYRDVIGNIITKPADILSTVLSSAGRILLTTEQITNGLLTEDGREINTARKKAGPSKEHMRQNNPGRFARLKNMLGVGKPKNTADGSKPMDVLIMHEGKMKRVMTADGWKTGAYRDKDGKVIKSPSDIDGPVYNFRGDFVLTEEELQQGIYSQDGKVISTKFYKANGLPGGKGLGGMLSGFGSKIKKGLGSIGSKLSTLRKNSWQWKQAKKEEDERNKKGDVTVNVENKDKDGKQTWIGKLLGGLGIMFGGMFTKMMTKFGGMFKAVRNAVLMSKMAGAAGGILGGGAGGGGRGKFGLASKLLGAGVAAGGIYGAHQYMSNAGESEEDDPMAPTADEQKLMDAAQAEEGSGGIMGTLSDINAGTGGIAGDLALTAATGYGVNKVMDMRRARRLNAARPGLASRFGRGVGGALGSGARDAGRAGSMAGRVGGAIARRLPGVAGLAARGASAVGKGLGWALNPMAAGNRLATAGRMVAGVGRLAVGAFKVARFLTGPVGLALGAATWIGGKLWENYKNKKNPLMRFRMSQYGFDFDDEEYTSKLLDLENLLSKHVNVNGEGQPSIKDSFPEDQVFELFGVNPDDPKNQEHVQRFIAWWIKRFKPVYLSYVKQTHALLKKFDISQIDDELNKTDKLTLLKGVNFTNKQNNPYLVSASPFLEPAEVPLTMDDVEKAYIKALKFINDMPDDKVTKAIDKEGDTKTAEDKTKEEKGGGFSWLDRTKTAITDMGNETLKVTSMLASKTDDLFGGWFSKAAENIKGLWGGLSGWLTSASDKLSAKMSEIWKNLSEKASGVMDMIAGSSAAGDAAVGIVEGTMDAAGGAWDSAKNALGFESNLGDGEKHILAAAKEAGITNPTELAALLATTAHESGNFRHTEENLRYSAAALRKTWPNRFGDPAYAEKVAKGGPQAVANAVYGGRMGNDQPGDGWKYRGRGYIQLTGKANYAQFAKDTGVDALRNPDLVARPDIGAKAALWFWKKNGKISAAAQRGDITGVTKIVNGGTNGLSDRKSKFQKYLSKLQGGELKTDVAAPAVVAKQPSSAPAAPQTAAAATQAGTAIPKSIARPTTPAATPLATAGTGFVTPDITNTKAHRMMTDANLSKKPEPASSTPQNQSKASAGTSTGPVNGKTPPWMKVALEELQRGVGENKDLARANSYFADLGFPNYKANVQSWCAAFVSWCLKNSGTAYNQQNPLSAKGGYVNWGKTLSKKDIPYGAIIVVAPSHVFFAAGVEGNYVKGLGGNQGKPGEVKYSNFPIDSILSVSWPKGATEQASSGAPTAIPKAANTDVARQQAARTSTGAVESDANAGRLVEPRNTPQRAASYQQAQQRSTEAVTNANDSNLGNLQLQESRNQTKLLTEIRDAVTGQRSDSNAMGDKTIGALGGMNRAQGAQIELITTAMSGMTALMKKISSNSKPESLSDQFPISARK